MSDFVSFAVSVCPFCCLEWLVFWIWRLFWRWVQHRMVVLCTDLLVSDRNSYIINMCLTIISLTDAFLGLFLWAFPEASFLFLIITNIGYLVFYFLCLSQLILNFSIYQNISDSACIIISEQKVFRIVSAYCFLSL